MGVSMDSSGGLPGRPEMLRLPDGMPVLLRVVGSHDAANLVTYFKTLSVESRRNRFLGTVSELAPTVLDRMLHMNGVHGLMLLAFACYGRDPTIISEAIQAGASDSMGCEISLSVADAWQRRGLGTLMLRTIERLSLLSDARILFADALRANTPMKHLARKEGFSIRSHSRDTRLIAMVKDLAISRLAMEFPLRKGDAPQHSPILR